MRINRKSFIKSTSIVAGGILFGSGKSIAGFFPDESSGLREIRKNIGIYTEKGGTIGWFASDDAALVIDSQFPDSAKNFMEKFKKKITRNIDVLFNTHHHGDHTRGNLYLKDFTEKIFAHENCPKLQKKQSEGTENEKLQVYADATFKDNWELDLGKEKVRADYFGNAHTGGDAVYHFENANVAHLGDLVFNKTYPFIDLAGGGTIKGWANVLEKVSKKYSADTIFIFGHSSGEENITGSKKDIIKMRDYLLALYDFTGMEIKNGKDLEQIKNNTSLPNFPELTSRREGAFAANLQAAYNEIKGIKVEY